MPGLTDFPTERMTFEHAIRWCIDVGGGAARNDWEQVLAETEGVHKVYRSWHDVLPAAPGSAP